MLLFYGVNIPHPAGAPDTRDRKSISSGAFNRRIVAVEERTRETKREWKRQKLVVITAL